MNQHLKSCKGQTSAEPYTNASSIEVTNTLLGDCSNVNTNVPWIEETNTLKEDYSNVNILFNWGEIDGETFTNNVDIIYEKIVYWKKNLFLLPMGNAGKLFIKEITRLLNSWIEDNALSCIAFKAIMIMPSLLLQKPSRNLKANDHLMALERRMDIWRNENIMELLHEGETIQKYLKIPNSNKNFGEIMKRFAALMKKGNVNAAINLLTDNMKNGILPFNKETLNLLKVKHPGPSKAPESIMLPDIPEEIHPVKCDVIDANLYVKLL